MMDNPSLGDRQLMPCYMERVRLKKVFPQGEVRNQGFNLVNEVCLWMDNSTLEEAFHLREENGHESE